MKTLVIGASENEDRYANKAIRSLLKHQHEVIALGRKKGQVENVTIDTGLPQYENVDTVTVYLNQNNQKPLYDYILNLKPRRIIFNPGAENPELEKLATDKGIEVEEACSLVLLSIGAY
ncbi:MAG: CoA-binding protein [Bacteroidia bacterium]